MAATNLLTGTINWGAYKPVTVPQAFNVTNVHDVPTLNTALHTGQINSQQWMQQFKQIQARNNGPKIQTGVVQNLNLFNQQSVVNQQDITPFKNTLVGAYQQAKSQAQYLSGPRATGAQQQQIINNQKDAQTNTAFLGQSIKTSNPTGGGVIQHLKNDIVSGFQHANPFSGVNKANNLISKTQQAYGLTPSFVKTLQGANTSATSKPLLGGAASGITYKPGTASNVVNRSQVTTGTPAKGQVGNNPVDTLVHEGLHQVWAANPQVHNTFATAYNQSITPQLEKYLQQTLNVSPSVNLSNFSKLPPALQDEVHSDAVHFYTSVPNQQVPNNALVNYYNNFVNVKQANASNSQVNLPKGVNKANLQEMGDAQGNLWFEDNKGNKYPIGNGVNANQKPGLSQVLTHNINTNQPRVEGTVAGGIQAQKMATQGATPAQIKAFQAKDAQAASNQQGKALNTLATVAGFSAPGEGILSRAAEKTGVTDALSAVKGKVVAASGKDEATNALINSQRVANATKSASLADKLGTPAVKEASTTRIPVVNPTQTNATRSAIGSTAVENANRTSIPVSGKSTQVSGKVATSSDTAYIKASNKLSDQYDKELSQIQKVPHPVTQQALQRNIDTKYNALQQNLDDKYGQTSISFKGKPTTLKETTGTDVTMPRSALSKTPEAPFNSTKIPEPKVITNTTPAPKEPKISSPSPNLGTISSSKVSGSALQSEQRAVEAGLVNDLGDEATYKTGSYKQEAGNAVNLVNNNPEEAMRIATGEKPGNNTIHEVAVRRAVENKALQNSDVDTLQKLANSSQHTSTSEAAQRLGSEGFNADHNSPVQAIREVAQARQNALLKRGEKTPEKVLASTVKDIQKTTESKLKISPQDWHSFINDLQCK